MESMCIPEHISKIQIKRLVMLHPSELRQSGVFCTVNKYQMKFSIKEIDKQISTI